MDDDKDQDFDLEIYEWIYRGPSRRLKKLYKELAAVEQKISEVRASNPVPEHAPSSYEIIRRELKPLFREHTELCRRIDRLQNDADEWGEA